MSKTSNQDLIETAEALDALIAKHNSNKLSRVFPDTGAYARSLYPKQIAFFEAGRKFKERALIGGNRSGKSEAGSYEAAVHATGLYPEWWKGRRFETPITVVVSGKTNLMTRDVIQQKLIGKTLMEEDFGTGMIPRNLIMRKTMRAGVPDAVQDLYVKHTSGGISKITFRSNEQGREAFEGIEAHVVWFDEEPPQEVYTEALMRTMTTEGIIFTTFTPLDGLSEVVLSFLPGGQMPEANVVNANKWVTCIAWSDIPHLTQKEQDTILAGTPAHIRDARSKGIPSVGEGKIYPVAEEDVVIDSFSIPPLWPRAYGMDTGWNRTAVVWMAQDPNTGTLYIYDEYYRGQAEPSGHVAAIKARGDWMNGIIDWAGTVNGERIMYQYQDLGLNVYPADKRGGSVDAGILLNYRLMCEGKKKVMRHCVNYIKEFRIYRYDKHGKPVKQFDHLMDADRYITTGFESVAFTQPDKDVEEEFYDPRVGDDVTGYSGI